MTVTWGSAVTVDASAIEPISIVKLTSSLSLVLYERAGNIKARTITTSGASPVTNAERDIDTNVLNQIIGVRLTNTSALISYVDGANTVARVLTISGTTVNAPHTKLVLTDFNTDNSMCSVDSTRALYCYNEGTNVKAVILSISGTTVTENAINTIEAADVANGVRCSAYSTTKTICTWMDSNTSPNPHNGMILNISGNTVTANTKKQIDTVNSQAVSTQDSYFTIALSSTKVVYGFSDTSSNGKYYVLTLNGNTFDIGPTTTRGSGATTNIYAAVVSTTSLIVVRKINGTTYEAESFLLTGGSSDTLTLDDTDTIAVAATDWIWAAPVDSGKIIAHFETTSSSVAFVSLSVATHIWFSTDGGATYTDIGDSSWGSNVVGGVVVVPGTAYQTIFAAVGTDLYKTVNGGTAWTLETAVGYEVDFIDLEKDNTTVFLAKRDAAGANRASLWDSVGASLTNINTGKSTTGGATSGGDVV